MPSILIEIHAWDYYKLLQLDRFSLQCYLLFYTNSYKMRIGKRYDVWGVHFYLNCNFEFRNANRESLFTRLYIRIHS